MSETTHQQKFYEAAYAQAARSIAVPDLKITGGTLPKNQRILNLGGGVSNDLWHLTGENLVVNADYAMAGLRIGQKAGVVGVCINLNSPSLPFLDKSFDLVVCHDILEHLLEPLPILKECIRVLREDGTIVISIPNHFYWPMRLRLLFGKGVMWRGLLIDHGRDYREWDYMHIRFFTYKGFRKFLEVAGLKPIKFYWDFGTLAHYCNPDRHIEPQLCKQEAGLQLSNRAKFGIRVIRPLWRFFNVVFPVKLRSVIVSLCPGLLSAGFYVRCKRQIEVQTSQEIR
ncbi:MAG TPA: methyltransferase domain-containing protein [Nitrososphaera sp.]|nr:methyltransferase domain-containing protein [Nitrososphaera sp.]